jgi:hypothetical protein
MIIRNHRFLSIQEQREVAADNPVIIRATASDRMRASRERRRRGSLLVEIEVDAGILNRLIAMEMLSVDQRTDRAAVGAALLRFVRAESSSTTGVHAFLGILAEELSQELKQRRPDAGYGWGNYDPHR